LRAHSRLISRLSVKEVSLFALFPFNMWTVSYPRRIGSFAWLLPIAFVILTACGSSRAAPEPTPTVDVGQQRVHMETTVATVFYEVQGTTTEAIFSYIEQNGPTDGEGQRGSGLTSVIWGYEWQGGQAGKDCAIRSMTIRADMTVTLPRHASLELLAESTRRNWSRYAEGVAVHEQTHVDIYKDGARSVQRLMQELPAQSTCDELERRIGLVWAQEQARINQEQAQFHIDEASRLDRERQPLAARIDQNRTELASLERQIGALDQTVRVLRADIDAMEKRIRDYEADITRVEESNLPPAQKQEQVLALVQKRNAEITRHNEKVEDHNAALTRRGELAATRSTLLAQTNELVETYNWAR
jgi:predicted secreted Zn-dependent protease